MPVRSSVAQKDVQKSAKSREREIEKPDIDASNPEELEEAMDEVVNEQALQCPFFGSQTDGPLEAAHLVSQTQGEVYEYLQREGKEFHVSSVLMLDHRLHGPLDNLQWALIWVSDRTYMCYVFDSDCSADVLRHHKKTFRYKSSVPLDHLPSPEMCQWQAQLCMGFKMEGLASRYSPIIKEEFFTIASSLKFLDVAALKLEPPCRPAPAVCSMEPSWWREQGYETSSAGMPANPSGRAYTMLWDVGGKKVFLDWDTTKTRFRPTKGKTMYRIREVGREGRRIVLLEGSEEPEEEFVEEAVQGILEGWGGGEQAPQENSVFV